MIMINVLAEQKQQGVSLAPWAWPQAPATTANIQLHEYA